MKRILALLLAFCTVFLCACGASAPKTDEAGYASKDEFLKDMADGISKRLEICDQDSSEMEAEELSEYFLKLVGFELSRIEKYQKLTFEDPQFDQLAHLYIAACQAQRFSAQNYKNSTLYSSLWDEGSSIRCAIITELYSRYDLPITAEQAESYKPASGGKVVAKLDGTLDFSTGLTMYSSDMVTYDEIEISKDKGQVLFNDKDIKVTLKSLEYKNGSYNVNFTIQNSTKTERVACFLSNGYVDDNKISCYHTHGYDFVDAGKKGNSYSYISDSDLKELNLSKFSKLQCALYVITTSGDSTGKYIAKVPLTIEGKAFHSA